MAVLLVSMLAFIAGCGDAVSLEELEGKTQEFVQNSLTVPEGEQPLSHRLIRKSADGARTSYSIRDAVIFTIGESEFGSKTLPHESFGKPVHFDLKLYVARFFRDTFVSANPRVVNRSPHKQRCIVHVSLFDKDGKLLSSASQREDIERQRSSTFASCMLWIHEDDIERVASYQIHATTEILPPDDEQD